MLFRSELDQTRRELVDLQKNSMFRRGIVDIAMFLMFVIAFGFAIPGLRSLWRNWNVALHSHWGGFGGGLGGWKLSPLPIQLLVAAISLTAVILLTRQFSNASGNLTSQPNELNTIPGNEPDKDKAIKSPEKRPAEKSKSQSMNSHPESDSLAQVAFDSAVLVKGAIPNFVQHCDRGSRETMPPAYWTEFRRRFEWA